MSSALPEDIARLLVELVEKTGLLRRELVHNKDIDKYERRVARIEQKLVALADLLETSSPELAKELRAAWSLPARSLAFRNADHQQGRDPR